MVYWRKSQRAPAPKKESCPVKTLVKILVLLAALLAGLSLLEQEKSPRYVEIYDDPDEE